MSVVMIEQNILKALNNLTCTIIILIPSIEAQQSETFPEYSLHLLETQSMQIVN